MIKDIETYIDENLCGDDREAALQLISFLQANGLEIVKDNGYWKDKIYHLIKKNDNCICFISIKDPDETDNRWTVWTADIDEALFDASTADEELKEAAWSHVDHCGNCGSCGGGRRKIIFGKEYSDVCCCTFRFDNPSFDDVKFLQKIIEIQLSGITNTTEYSSEECDYI